MKGEKTAKTTTNCYAEPPTPKPDANEPRRNQAAAKVMPNWGQGALGIGTSKSSTNPNPACRMSSCRARTNHAFARERNTTLSATSMDLTKNWRNCEQGGFVTIQSQWPLASRKSRPF